ncbi:MAG: vanadium-dependent haloperoxidase [Pyrinomonadaceae bacterium]
MNEKDDKDRTVRIGSREVVGLGSFHKTLPHNEFGEVERRAFRELLAATAGDGSGFGNVAKGSRNAAKLSNPQSGLSADQLIHHPASYSLPSAPSVLSETIATEMTELYWMSVLRDIPFNEFEIDPLIGQASSEVDELFRGAISTEAEGFIRGTDLPNSNSESTIVTRKNLFRLGAKNEDIGPMLSQFFVRPVSYGTQTIDVRQRPYKSGRDYLTKFDEWLSAQNSGKDRAGQSYSKANEDSSKNFESSNRYISTMRDLSRFVNKDALYQAFLNTAIILLSGEAKWTQGNPYGDFGRLRDREAGFGVLGGPHILALVSEVATRALKVVWNQKWQTHLRLRPEAYGGLVHVQNIGVKGVTRPYGLPEWVSQTEAANMIRAKHGTLLLPMSYTPGSPTHPAYGAGHATVAGACVTVLKAFFKTFETVDGVDRGVPFNTLVERDKPYGPKKEIVSYITGYRNKKWDRFRLGKSIASKLTIEGELNKLAQNVAMGRSMGGVHWRTDNTRSLVLGEALAAEILADITNDANEKPEFEFRTFARKEDGEPKKVSIRQGKIYVDGKLKDTHTSAL